VLAELQIVEITMPDWPAAYEANVVITAWEAAQVNRRLMQDPSLRSKLSPTIAARLAQAARVPGDEAAAARRFGVYWSNCVTALFQRVQLLVAPTVAFFPPPLETARRSRNTALTAPVNLAGLPALTIPVPSGRRIPAGLQLIGPANGEALLLTTGMRLESALG
jgi:Asp-tRNA(Asn)/Glu-tRNA(Gln) amidotransferase A subunit family amidase